MMFILFSSTKKYIFEFNDLKKVGFEKAQQSTIKALKQVNLKQAGEDRGKIGISENLKLWAHPENPPQLMPKENNGPENGTKQICSIPFYKQ